jgi:hypothetical protein
MFVNIMTMWTEEHTLQFTFVLLPTDCFETPVTYGVQFHCLATKSTLLGYYVNPKNIIDF